MTATMLHYLPTLGFCGPKQELEGTWLSPVEFADFTGVVALGTSTQACVLGASNLERGMGDGGWGMGGEGRGSHGPSPVCCVHPQGKTFVLTLLKVCKHQIKRDYVT